MNAQIQKDLTEIREKYDPHNLPVFQKMFAILSEDAANVVEEWARARMEASLSVGLGARLMVEGLDRQAVSGEQTSGLGYLHDAIYELAVIKVDDDLQARCERVIDTFTKDADHTIWDDIFKVVDEPGYELSGIRDFFATEELTTPGNRGAVSLTAT